MVFIFNLDKVSQKKLFPTMINKKVGNENINQPKRAYLRKRACLRQKKIKCVLKF